MNKSVLMCLFLSGALILNTVIASVTVTIKQEQYIFTHAPQLVDVLNPIATQENWYWPSAALYKNDDENQLEKTRQLVIKSLSNLTKSYQQDQPKLASSIEQLKTTIASWYLARRLPTKIDYDWARIEAAKNPRLPQGKYILDIALRKNTVQIFGAINKTTIAPHQSHTDVSEYINDDTRTELAEKDYILLIQADGRTIKAPVAYWNKTHQEVMPSSQVYVPFKDSLFHPEFAIINQQIATLALNRVR